MRAAEVADLRARLAAVERKLADAAAYRRRRFIWAALEDPEARGPAMVRAILRGKRIKR